MPADKPVEARRQTQHKLETMDRYWRTWCLILAQARNRGFCERHLWLVDTMAGTGLHESSTSPDGEVPGTPFQAVLAARATQRAFAGVTVHVRAVDINQGFAETLDKLVTKYRGAPPDHVDVDVQPLDWADAVPAIADEIRSERGHNHPQGYGQHAHRSLWFVDPFGVEPLSFATTDQLPAHAEVIVNFDENAVRRHAGKDLALMGRIYRTDTWRSAAGGPTGSYARLFADQFPRWGHRSIHPLRPTGSQDRFFVHLSESDKAIVPFGRAVKNGLKAGTLIAGELLTTQQKKHGAETLRDRFAGETLTLEEMHASGVPFTKQQLRVVCQAADDLGLGEWIARPARMTWFERPLPDPTFEL